MNYIVLDLEWNQGDVGHEGENPEIPFEVVEIGAIKLNDKCVMIDEFSRLVKPNVYHEMNQITSKLIHLQMQELERGTPFPEVCASFLDWCGQDYIFCTWGNLDLTELQRNMRYYQMPDLSDGPIAFLDVQKLYSLLYEDGKNRRSLEYAVDARGIQKDIPFHRAFSDAYYTGRILSQILEQKPAMAQYVSFDIYHPPVSRAKEIKICFGKYAKYISREFESRAEAFGDKEVISSKCYLCHRNLRKKIKWFTPNSRHYYCLAYCEKHGYLKGKIRVRKSFNDKVYIVKTTKLISDGDAMQIREKYKKAKELRRKHN